MELLDIPEDVLCYIITLCVDVHSLLQVLVISHTNKYLKHLAFTPTVWISVVQNLQDRGFVDLLSSTEIQALSTQSLVTIVNIISLVLTTNFILHGSQAEILDGGERANLVVCLRAAGSTTPIVEIVALDLVTGIADILFRNEFTDAQFNHPTSPKICGEIAVFRMYNRPRWSEMHIIINWRTQQYCKITTPSGSRVVADLLPGHFILITTMLEPVQYRINVYDLKSLTTRWSPLGKITAEDAVYFPVVSQTIKAADISHSPSDMPITMAVHESPLESGVYRVWLHLPYCSRRPFGTINRASLSSFRLALPRVGSTGIAWRRTCCVYTEPDVPYGGISYSGHTWRGQRIFPPETSPYRIQVETAEELVDSGHISPYSGALTCTLLQRPIVYWYK
ncbi:hypothetical protein B0H11DRAFT_2280923 [Mycena galericulata]|nr:hypothetical protein B0H11DRAFT_2280923 [Mycena galericulata]